MITLFQLHLLHPTFAYQQLNCHQRYPNKCPDVSQVQAQQVAVQVTKFLQSDLHQCTDKKYLTVSVFLSTYSQPQQGMTNQLQWTRKLTKATLMQQSRF